MIRAAACALWLLAAAPAAAGTGACCMFEGCVPAATDPECAALGGVFLPGEDCAAGACGTGACCFEQSCNTADAFSCISNGRIFAGAGTSCLDDPCEAGVGACCLAGGTCMDLSPEECAAGGGTWLGAGTNCGTGPCTLGACCLPGDCVNVAQHECNDLGGQLVPGDDCATEPCTDCPAGTLFAQQRDPPDDFTAFTSEADPGLARYENYSGAGGAIEAVTWWGLDLDYLGGTTFGECIEPDPTFTISFHLDAAGQPGAAVCSYTLAATRTPLGIFYLGTELNEYSVTLPAPCVLPSGWIGIQGLGDPECWFLWMSAGVGTSWCDGCDAEEEGSDLSLCLIGPEGGISGACCDDSTSSCADGVDIAACAAAGLRFAPGQTCASLDPPCGQVEGACCIPDGSCSITDQAGCGAIKGSWLGANTDCAQCPCIVPCPPGATAEGEPVCTTAYVDQFNGGCVAALQLFSPIALGETVCGQSGVFESGLDVLPDMDWYEITLEAATDLKWTATAEFPGRIWIYDARGGCPGAFLVTTPGDLCEPMTLTADVDAGTYWLIISPTAFTDESSCGTHYVATATCAADVDGDGSVDVVDLLLILGSWGTPGGDVNGDGTTDVVDLLIVLGAWGGC